jgi:hypothetical protein
MDTDDGLSRDALRTWTGIMYPTSTVVNVHGFAQFAHSDSVKRHLPNEYAADLAPAHFPMVLCLQKHSQVAAHHGIVVHDEDAGTPRSVSSTGCHLSGAAWGRFVEWGGLDSHFAPSHHSKPRSNGG